MQPSPRRDLAVGLFVLIGLAAIGYLSIRVGGISYTGPGGLILYATFVEVGGLKPRAPVAIAGDVVGHVERIDLDEDLRARVTLDLDPDLELSADTSAGIRTSGLLGVKIVALVPGGEDEILYSGEEIAYTESALSIERLIGKFVHDSGVQGD